MSRTARHVLALLGGASGEHSISIRSAATVVPALERAGYRVTCVGITREGEWRLGDFSGLLAKATSELVSVDPAAGSAVTLARASAGRARLLAPDAARGVDLPDPFDIVFPILHGPNGEDGTVQGLFEVIGVPYVGAGPAASAMAMDKLCMKTLAAGVRIPQTDFLPVGRESVEALARRIDETVHFPCFVKPANLGSSVGISRVTSAARLAAALDEARRWDERVLIERAVDAREIEIALLGDETPLLSPIGEIVAGSGFYDFDTKYVGDEARLIAPAELTRDATEAVRAIAAKVWDLIGCRGLARCDFFLDRRSGRVLLNEINTIPGFTAISMYPRLWQVAGLSIESLVDALVRFGMGERVSLPEAVVGRR